MGEAVYGTFSVKTTALDSNEDYTVASLEIKNLKVRKFRSRLKASLIIIFLNYHRLMKPETYHIGSSRVGPTTAFHPLLWRC